MLRLALGSWRLTIVRGRCQGSTLTCLLAIRGGLQVARLTPLVLEIIIFLLRYRLRYAASLCTDDTFIRFYDI